MLLMTTLAPTVTMKIAKTKAMTTAKAITKKRKKIRVTMTMSEADQCQYQNNCAPTPPLTQH